MYLRASCVAVLLGGFGVKKLLFRRIFLGFVGLRGLGGYATLRKLEKSLRASFANLPHSAIQQDKNSSLGENIVPTN